MLTIRECDCCGEQFGFDQNCYYGDSMYQCQDCTKKMMEEAPGVYDRCVNCGELFCVVHAGTDRHKKLCYICNVDSGKEYSDDTVTDLF